MAIVLTERRAVGPHGIELDALIDAAENAEDVASVRAWKAYVVAVGRDAAIANSHSGAEAKRLLDGEGPVRIWREKRGMTQRSGGGGDPGRISQRNREPKEARKRHGLPRIGNGACRADREACRGE